MSKAWVISPARLGQEGWVRLDHSFGKKGDSANRKFAKSGIQRIANPIK